MNVDPAPESANPRKRTVDADNENVSIPDDSILKYLIGSAFALYEELKLCEYLSNITVAHQVMSIIQGSHNIMRKMANTRSSTHSSMELTATITSVLGTSTITYKRAIELMRPSATLNGLVYTASNRTDNNHWYGIANPIFNIMSAFKMRFDEIRLGVSKMPVAKRGNTTDYVDVAQYGLTPAHHVLLEGSTYKPERRSAMAQTLGPMTALIASYKSKDPYRNKWVEAVKRDMAHIPHSLHLCNAIYGKRSEEITPAVSALADCVLIAGSRNAQRAFFPLNFLMFAMAKPEFGKACGLTLEAASLPSENVDFSGKGMWLIYKICSALTWKVETALDDISASQIIYHAIFETQNEDLGVLQQITALRTPWKLRSELASRFWSEGKVVVDFKLPK